MDIRDQASISRAVGALLATTGRLDVLVNNAGGVIIGPIEETSPAQAQELFGSNLFGPLGLIQAVLPTMRQQKRGRIIFISSVVGFVPAPYMGLYAASKHAIEALSESLDHEVRTFGIRCVLVEPGYMRTNMPQHSIAGERLVDAYQSTREPMRSHLNQKVEKGDDPRIIAAIVVKAVQAARPRLRYQAGKGISLLAKMRSFLPAGMFDSALRKDFGLRDA
jgi:NAD(P)-dependent dehydrogenase (short-subunit alcohol dehydrogenase family)